MEVFEKFEEACKKLDHYFGEMECLEAQSTLSQAEKARLNALVNRISLFKSRIQVYQSLIIGGGPIAELRYTFRSVSPQEIARVTGIRLPWNDWNIAAGVANARIDLPPNFISSLQAKLRRNRLTTEQDRRVFIDFYLDSILANPEFDDRLIIAREVGVKVQTLLMEERTRLVLEGTIDFLIHPNLPTLNESIYAPQEANLVVVEAKKEWPSDAIYQCIAEAAAIHKARKDAGKLNRRAWGILSNASLWRFVRIDNDGTVWCSGEFSAPLQRNHLDMDRIGEVYRLLNHVFTEAMN